MTTSDYLGHDLGLGGFNTDAVDLTDVADAEEKGMAPPVLYFVVQASVKTVGSTYTSDGRRLKVTGNIVDGFRLDAEQGRAAVNALRTARRHAEDAAAGVANLPGFEGGEVPDVGTPHKVAGDGSVMTDADVAHATCDPLASADDVAREALADREAAAEGTDEDEVPRWATDEDGFEDPAEGPAVDELKVEGDELPALGLAYVGWAWTTGNPLDLDEAKAIDALDGQDAFDLWELDVLIDLEVRGQSRDEVLAALRGRRTAELALAASEEPWPGMGKEKVADVEKHLAKLAGAINDESGEEDVLGALKLVDGVERFETSHKDRAGVLNALTPIRAELLARLFPGATS